jgi:phosphoglycolate phosphatase-like HAD superfamily hydrolase
MSSNYKKQMLIFDVDDTLAKSKQPISKAMSNTLKKLSNKYLISIITGGTLKLINKQVISRLKNWTNSQLSRLFLMPVSGSQFYFYNVKTNS